MNNWKEKSKNKIASGLPLFDLFIDDFKFTSGEISDPRESTVVDEIYKQVLSYIGKDNLEIEMELKNFGKGADWSIALIEFFSKNDPVNALANVGGLLGLAQLFGGLFESIKKKNKNIKIGFKSAKLLALGKVLKQSKLKNHNLKIVVKKEITKNILGFDEKCFLFVIRRGERYFLVVIDWNGKIKIFSKI